MLIGCDGYGYGDSDGAFGGDADRFQSFICPGGYGHGDSSGGGGNGDGYSVHYLLVNHACFGDYECAAVDVRYDDVG